MKWQLTDRGDPIARDVADRHYNRQKPGSPQFVNPSRCLVLLATQKRGYKALWVTSWPFSQYVKHRWAGAWVNSLFRNEGYWPSPDLIREAVSATRWYATYYPSWLEPEPSLGMITFIDTTKVKQKEVFGKCYRDAGFIEAGYTEGGLLALQMRPCAMPPPAPPLIPSKRGTREMYKKKKLPHPIS